MHNHQHEHVKLERNINVAVLTISDTRDEETDKGGQLVQSLLKEINVTVEKDNYKIVKDDKNAITLQLKQWLDEHEEIDAIITTGGTGISQRDVTIEAIRPLLSKRIRRLWRVIPIFKLYRRCRHTFTIITCNWRNC